MSNDLFACHHTSDSNINPPLSAAPTDLTDNFYKDAYRDFISCLPPEKLNNITSEINRIMESKGCYTRLNLTADGKVLISNGWSGTGCYAQRIAA